MIYLPTLKSMRGKCEKSARKVRVKPDGRTSLLNLSKGCFLLSISTTPLIAWTTLRLTTKWKQVKIVDTDDVETDKYRFSWPFFIVFPSHQRENILPPVCPRSSSPHEDKPPQPRYAWVRDHHGIPAAAWWNRVAGWQIAASQPSPWGKTAKRR